MKKQIILILLLLGNLTTSFSNSNSKTAFDDLVGTYQGITLTEEGLEGANKIFAELTSDFNLKVTENFDGLYIEHINEKLSPQAGGEMKDGTYVFDLKAVSEESEFAIIKIIIHNEVILAGTNLLMSISYMKHSKEVAVFAVNKDGGIPEKPTKNIDFSEIHEFVTFSGKTKDNTFGDFIIEWYPTHHFGYLRYKHVTNVFKITKSDRKYFLYHNNTDDIELEFLLSYNQRLQLQKIHKGMSLFEMVKVKQYRNDKVMENDEECLVEIGNFFYDMIHDEFKENGDYTLTHQNKSNGNGIEFILTEDKPIVYMGGIKDGKFHGAGFSTTIEASEKGIYKNGTRSGHFYISNLEGGRASGEYKDGVEEGLWKVQKANKATFDMVFQNGKKISSTATNKGIKNTQIAKHIEDAQYQLKNSKRYVEETISIANGCNDITTLRSYQVCIRPLKTKIDLFSVAIVAADKELSKAIKEAEKSGCKPTLQILKNAEDDLWKANGKFGKAYKAITEAYHATTVSTLTAEYNKGIAALKEAVTSIDEYNIWIAKLALETCYEYSTTDNSTLPSRFSSKSRISSEMRNSLEEFEGDNLLLLMGRKMNDPAVQKILKDVFFDFKENGQSSSERKFYSAKNKFTITFKNDIITQFSFLYQDSDKDNYFKKQLPLDIPLAKGLSWIFKLQDSWSLDKAGDDYIWSLKKYQLQFEVIGDIEKSIAERVEIKAINGINWNSYYQQFE